MHVLLKCASVVCVMTRRCCGVREERLLRRKGGGGVLFECRPLWEAETWRSAQQPPDYINGRIGGFVLH